MKGLSTREAIADALYRCVQGLDTYDEALFRSALVDLKDFKFGFNGSELKGEGVIMDAVFHFVGPMATTHSLSNIRIDVESDAAEIASMTAYAIAVHYRKGEGIDPTTSHLTAGAIYDLDLIKDKSDGQWKIQNWGVKLLWRSGDASIVAREDFSVE